MNGKIYYGLLSQNQLREMALNVCDCLGHGKNNKAYSLLLGTSGAETVRGEYSDPTKGAGMGITQFDKGSFYDVHNRTSKDNKIKIFNTFGIHLDYLEWEELRYNPLLSMIYTRLKYILITEQIPVELEGQALYWKVHYNTYHPNAKGSPEEYISKNKKFLQDDEKFLNETK